jgi:hypothetical protein
MKATTDSQRSFLLQFYSWVDDKKEKGLIVWGDYIEL